MNSQNFLFRRYSTHPLPRQESVYFLDYLAVNLEKQTRNGSEGNGFYSERKISSYMTGAFPKGRENILSIKCTLRLKRNPNASEHLSIPSIP